MNTQTVKPDLSTFGMWGTPRGTRFRVGRYECPQCDTVVIGDPGRMNPNNLCRCGASLRFVRHMEMDCHR